MLFDARGEGRNSTQHEKEGETEARPFSSTPPQPRISPLLSELLPGFHFGPKTSMDKDSQTDMSDDEADEIWNQSNKRMFGEGKHLSTVMPYVSSFTRGNTLKVIAEIKYTGGMQHVNLALDT